MTARRWIGLAVVFTLLAVAAVWLLESEPVRVKAPTLWRPDSGVLRLTAPRSSFTVQGATAPSAALTPTTDRSCVRGRVVDAVSGAGLGAAQVTLATFAGAVTATTDARGAFELRGLSEGTVWVAEVSAVGYLPFRPRWGDARLELRLLEGLCVSDLTLALTPRVDIEGEVLGPDGGGVPFARVSIGSASEAPGAALTTSATGRFTFAAVDGALLVATAPPFSPAVALVDFRASATRRLTLRLGPPPLDAGAGPRTLAGLVLDERDAGVPGATVRVSRSLASAEGRWERLEAELETSAGGAFTVELEPPGPWQLAAAATGRVSALVTTDGEPVVLRLEPGATLEGTVVDGAGHAVSGFAVLLQRRVGALERDDLQPHHVIDPDGRFRLTGLPPGSVEVVVAAPGLAPSAPMAARLEVGRVAHVDARLSRGAQVSGVVLDRERQSPLEGARVSLEHRQDEPLGVVPVARTDGRGQFSLEGLPAGRRSLFVVAAGHDARLLTVDLRDDAPNGPLTIDLAAHPDGGTPQLELVGVGAVLVADGDALRIDRTVPGGGAAEAGLVAGDVVLRIDGTPVSSLGFAGAVERIRGSEDSTVVLEVRRASGQVEAVVTPRRRVTR